MPRLTEITIRNARPANRDRLLSDGGCLYLRIRPNGARRWVVRLDRRGVRRVHTLGAYPDVSLAKARAEAARLVAIERGTARVDVATAVAEYMDIRIRPRYRRVNNAEVYAGALNRALGHLAVDTVRAVDVSRLVAAYRRRAPVASMRLLAFSKGFFSWCVSFGYLDQSPVASVEARSFNVVEESRDRVLTDAEVHQFWNADDLPHVPLLRFLLLSGVRIGEAQGSVVNHIKDDWLTITVELSKNKREHRVYIAPLAAQQIEDDAAPALFRSVSPTAVQAAVKRWNIKHGIEPRWTPHDLRRTFATRCGDLGVAPHITSALLNHTIGGAAATPIYLRSEWTEERKAATVKLARHIAKVVK